MSLVDNDLVVQSLNFHGNNLTNFLKNYPEFQRLDLKNVNYGIYQSRSKELRTEDRGQRLLLHQFISQNLTPIFRKQDKLKEEDSSAEEKKIEPKRDDAIAIMPPLESFIKVPEEDRSTHFFDLISLHDILLCRISAKNAQGLLLNVLGFAPGTGKSRYIRDLRHKAFCPSEELLPNQVRPYEVHDVVCVYVLEVRKESQRLLVSMKSDMIKDEIIRKKLGEIKFGQYEKDSLPTVYLYTEQVLDRRLTYNEVLEKNLGFPNPSNVEVLAEELGLSNYAGQSSLFSSLQHQFPSSKTAPALRKTQASKMAFKHVAAGIKYFKANQHVEAFQCLNQALQIDPENVEALVARGALYANRSNLETAIKDFEAALKHNAFHKNARKYMCETLFALGREHEDDLKEDEALKHYERILEINPDHQGAREAVNKIKGIFQEAQELDIDLKAFGNNKEMAEKFREFIIAEREKKKQQASPPRRSISPFSQKVSLVNPSALMAPGIAPTANQQNIVDANPGQPEPPGTGEDKPAILQQDFSVPPPNFLPPAKSAQELEYEAKVAEFLHKTTSGKDPLDAKIQQHLQPRKKRTFTDFPMPCSSSGAPKEAEVVETRTVSYKSPQREASKIVYDSAMGMYKKVPTSPERIVKKVSKSPSPPPRKSHSRSSASRRSRSRERRRSRSKSKEGRSSRRSRSRDRRRSRSRSRGDRRDSRKRSRSRERPRRRSRSPMLSRYPPPSGAQPHKRRRSDDGLHELMSETDKIKMERERIRKEKEQLLKLGQEKKADPILASLPRPVPLRSTPSTSSSVKKERREISMKVKTTGGKILEDKKWQVEDDDDEELEVAKAMESVRQAVDGDNKASPIDPTTASKILPGARNYQDIEKYLNQAKKEKLDLLKKKNKW